MTTLAKVEIEGLDAIIKELNKFGVVAQDDISASLTKSGQVLTRRMKQLVPRPGQGGYTGFNETHRKEQRPVKLWQTIKTRKTKYREATSYVVGPLWETGRHSWWVEHGHKVISHGQDTGARTTAEPFVIPAGEETRDQQRRAFEAELTRRTMQRYGST